MKINVTQADIDKARTHRTGRTYSAPQDCPIARAIAREHSVTGVSVNRYRVSFNLSDERINYYATKRMNDFIGRFDEGKPVAPDTFHINRRAYR